MSPNEIQTNETFQFILENISSPEQRILEVGCGNGELAKRLQDEGHLVIAVDSSSKQVEFAKALGVDARETVFPNFTELPFDIILFTRSIHHIQPLAPAVARAKELLKPKGRLIVEDFAFSDTNESAAAWFYCLVVLLESCACLLPAENSFGRKLLQEGGGFHLWHEHTHKLNSAAEVLNALNQNFKILKTEQAPYFYRYIAQMLTADEKGGKIAAAVLDLEKKTGAINRDFLIGRRFVVTSYS